MEDWLQDGAADGFNSMPPVLPAMLEGLVADVVPLLRRHCPSLSMPAILCGRSMACLVRMFVSQPERARG
jgi:hypothetical protein